MRGWPLSALLLALAGPAASQGRPPQPLAIGQTVEGELTASDLRRRSGKLEDRFLLRGRRGQRVDLQLRSTEFDAYLALEGPDGFALANDDEPGGGSLDSRLVVEFPADGDYRVTVSSFRAGETGTYRLAAAAAGAGTAPSLPERAEAIALGATVAGRLVETDARLASGAFADRYRFAGRRGERVLIDLAAAKFDTVLVLRRPDGSEIANDDSPSDGRPSTNSRIDAVLAEDGDYVLAVTSFRPGETGEYRLTLAPSPGLARHAAVPSGPRVLALLVGVSDYGGRTSDLPATDEDARRLFESLRAAGLLHPASVLLTNEQATRKAVATAFARAAEQAGPDDLFLFFFSGHGDQIDVPVSAAELDGRSETIELYDAAMTDSEVAPLFAAVRSRLALVAIDACFSGGFRELIDRPNVMGLFSSEEDLTSLVASRFKAGGFLAYFLREGLTGEADEDGDRIVTAGELAAYVRRRFGRAGEIPASTREEEADFQNLVVARGGVHVDEAILRLGPAQAPGAAGPGSR